MNVVLRDSNRERTYLAQVTQDHDSEPLFCFGLVFYNISQQRQAREFGNVEQRAEAQESCDFLLYALR